MPLLPQPEDSKLILACFHVTFYHQPFAA